MVTNYRFRPLREKILKKDEVDGMTRFQNISISHESKPKVAIILLATVYTVSVDGGNPLMVLTSTPRNRAARARIDIVCCNYATYRY
ncbi:hypothetical protein Y032_0387g477 [Ancylostoma ceylanicum]|nr:hypothetical protein Y032_0387g477 [Ancylostoma ceylanicum]